MYLELGEVNGTEGRLRIVVTEATARGPEEPLPTLPSLKARLIASDENSPTYEITWPSFVGYAVRDESASVVDLPPIGTASFEEISDKAFSNFVGAGMIAYDFLDPIRAWRLVCLNHVINVAARCAPTIQRLNLQAT